MYRFDASAEPLGRLATKVSVILMGKHRPAFERYKKEPTPVIVIHSDLLVLTGRKWQGKKYYRHSGFLGNLKTASAAQMRARDSRQIIRLAVMGMLPKNKLRKTMMKQLIVYKHDAPNSA